MSPDGLTSGALGLVPLVGAAGRAPDLLVGVCAALPPDEPQAERTVAHAVNARPSEIARRIERLQEKDDNVRTVLIAPEVKASATVIER